MQYVTFSYASSIWLKAMLKQKPWNLKASIKLIFIKFLEMKHTSKVFTLEFIKKEMQ